MQGLIHYNPALPHQREHAYRFCECGFHATTNPYKEADIHVVSGPWYCRDYWNKHPRVLMIDRAWWGDPDCVSIGWLQPDGSRKFAHGSAPRPKPEMREWEQGEENCLILADYGQDVDDISDAARERFSRVVIRRHPAESKNDPLQVRDWDCVIGSGGTAIFEAIINGVPAICLDPKNECAPVCSGSIDAPLFRGDREQWLHDMSYKQFSLAEISDGTAWRLLKDVQ